MLVIDTRIKLLLFILINFMVFGLKDFILGSVCFFFICILSCLMGQKKIVLKYLIFYVVIAVLAPGDRDHILSGVFNQFLSALTEPVE